MKRVYFLTLGFALTTLPLFSVPLDKASNEEILGELGARLKGTSAPSPSSALYVCEGRYLYVKLSSPTGVLATKSYTAVSDRACTEQAEILNRHRRTISRFLTIAVCEDRYLYQLVLNPAGTFGAQTSNTLTDVGVCLSQAKTINESH